MFLIKNMCPLFHGGKQDVITSQPYNKVLLICYSGWNIFVSHLFIIILCDKIVHVPHFYALMFKVSTYIIDDNSMKCGEAEATNKMRTPEVLSPKAEKVYS